MFDKRWPERMRPGSGEHGVPRGITDDLIEVGSALVRLAEEGRAQRIDEGGTVAWLAA